VSKWLLLVVAIVCEVTATLSLRGALDQPQLYFVVAIGYVTAFGCLAALLRSGTSLGVANGIWAASGVGATALLSALFFDERLTATMLLGMALLVVGVLVVEIGSQRAHASLGEDA